jgi:hypothetical protein
MSEPPVKQAEPRRTSAKKPESRVPQGKTPPDDDEGIFSGRLLTAATIAVAMVVIPLSPLSALMTKKTPTSAARSAWKVGGSEELHITVVTADYKKLGCADERVTEHGDHCEYRTDRDLFPRKDGEPVDDNKRHTLQPYRTTDGHLLFTAGFWAQPEISTRLHNEPAQGVPDTKLARFIASCRVKFIAEWSNPRLRWAATDKFSTPTNSDGKAEEVAMVGEVSDCHILEDEKY